MTWFLAVVVVLAIGAVAVLVAGRGPSAEAGLSPAYDNRPDALLPADRPVTGADLRRLRLSTSIRGYRAAEVDALLERLAAQLDATRAAGSVRDPGDGSGRLS